MTKSIAAELTVVPNIRIVSEFKKTEGNTGHYALTGRKKHQKPAAIVKDDEVIEMNVQQQWTLVNNASLATCFTLEAG